MTYAYRDTLIGPNNAEITRGMSNNYSWSVRVSTNHHSEDGLRYRLLVEITRDSKTVTVDNAPNYVMADIARVMTLASVASINANKASLSGGSES